MIAYLMTWTEHERGWGQRPDGYSLHTTKEEYAAYLKAYQAKLPLQAPDEYSTPDGTLQAVEVDKTLASQLAKTSSIRLWQSQLSLEVGETGARKVSLRKPPVRSFIQECLAGKARAEEVDDWVARWHEGDGQGKELHEFLGMSNAEYEQWMHQPLTLYKVLYERQRP